MRCLIFVGKRTEEAFCSFADQTDLAEIAAWPSPSAEGDQDVADAHEFAVIAGKRWYWYEKYGYALSSLEALHSRIAKSSRSEGVMFAVLKVPGTSNVLGLALFRRTWYNHVSLDYLTANPKSIGHVRGIGLALMSFVCSIALEIGSDGIWLETTPSSAERYKKWFPLAEVRDLLIIDKAQFDDFLRAQREAFEKAGLPSR